MERVENAQELRAIFQQTRLAPLGNTFLKADADEPEEPVVVRRRRSINLKAFSIPDYIPHQLVSMYGDSDIFEDMSASDISTRFSKSFCDLINQRKAGSEPAKASMAMLLGRRASSGKPDMSEPAFIGAAPLTDEGTAERMSWNRQNNIMLGTLPPALGLQDMVKVLSQPGTPPLRPAPGLEYMVPTPPCSPLLACAQEEPFNDRAATHGSGSGSKVANNSIQGPITTLMIRNLPHELLQSQLAVDMDACGFKGEYDFLYMPSTFGTGRGKGYAFVNFATPEVADCFSALWHNTCRFGNPSEHVLLNVSVACIQGRDANVARWDTSKMRRIRNNNHRPLVTVLMTDSRATPPTMPQMQLPPAATPAPLRPPPPTLATTPAPSGMLKTDVAQGDDDKHRMVGKWCKIDGLQRMTHANGLWGMVEAYDDDLERYIMRVPVDADHWFMAKILRENLDIPMQSY